MDRDMTFTAKWDYIEPVFRFIAKMVMIVFRFFAAHITRELAKRREITPNDSIINGVFGFSLSGVILAIAFVFFLRNVAPCFTLPISFPHSPTFWSLFTLGFILLSSICFFVLTFIGDSLRSLVSQIRTLFTFGFIPTRAPISSVKFRDCFNRLAFGTLFRYDLDSHIRFPETSLIKATVGIRPACGLFIIPQERMVSSV